MKEDREGKESKDSGQAEYLVDDASMQRMKIAFAIMLIGLLVISYVVGSKADREVMDASESLEESQFESGSYREGGE